MFFSYSELTSGFWRGGCLLERASNPRQQTSKSERPILVHMSKGTTVYWQVAKWRQPNRTHSRESGLPGLGLQPLL